MATSALPLKIFMCMFASVYTRVLGCPRRPEGDVGSPKLAWVQGTELGSSARIGALSLQAISPGPTSDLLYHEFWESSSGLYRFVWQALYWWDYCPPAPPLQLQDPLLTGLLLPPCTPTPVTGPGSSDQQCSDTVAAHGSCRCCPVL